jgi:hypothetical protein
MPPPGVSFLARLALRVFSIPIALGVGLHYISRRVDAPVPVWATVLLTIASLPMYVTYRVKLRDVRQQREADALGARLAPMVQGKSWGNIDLLKQLMHNRKYGYPGEHPSLAPRWSQRG